MLQHRTPSPILRCNIIESMTAGRAIAQQELHGVGARNAQAIKLLGVGRQLQQRTHLRPARKLRILHKISTVMLTDYEVSKPDKALVTKTRLEDDRSSDREGRECLRNRSSNRCPI